MLSKEDELLIINAYNSCFNLKEAGKICNVSGYIVRKVRAKHGVRVVKRRQFRKDRKKEFTRPMVNGRHVFSEAEEAAIAKDYIKLQNLVKLAKDYGVSKHTIRKVLEENGIVIRLVNAAGRPNSRKLTGKLEKQICKAYLSEPNVTKAEVGAKFNISVNTVSKALTKNSIPNNILKRASPLKESIDKGSATRRAIKIDFAKKVIGLWESGKSTKTISKLLNFSRSKIAVIVIENVKFSIRVRLMIHTVLNGFKGKNNAAHGRYLRKLLDKVSSTYCTCAICGNDVPYLEIEHCHTTGLIRGYACRTCNVALGEFRDKTKLIRRAIDYLNAAKLREQT